MASNRGQREVQRGLRMMHAALAKRIPELVAWQIGEQLNERAEAANRKTLGATREAQSKLDSFTSEGWKRVDQDVADFLNRKKG